MTEGRSDRAQGSWTIGQYNANQIGHSPSLPRTRIGAVTTPPLPGAIRRSYRGVTSALDSITVSENRPEITRDEVAHLARLARLAVTDEELDLFAGQLDVILGSIARISEVAAGDIEPTSHAVPLQNVLRADVVLPSLPREAVLASAPAVEDYRFRVPQILGEEE
jgi:aspartyl-tRNA(Asn)/glutamyl-tRNA(Gln) amidotransferase subunit C